jgi:hypothetical protein
MKVAAGFLPLRHPAEILFAYPYTLFGESRVCVVYLYDGDGQPAPDDFLAASLIPIEHRPQPVAPASTVAACVWDVPGQAPVTICAQFPLCECPPPADWEQ